MIKQAKRVGLYVLIFAILMFVMEIFNLFFVYSQGSHIGKIINWKHPAFTLSWEGTLLLGDQGSNTWDFSVRDSNVEAKCQEAHDHEWRVKMIYREYRRAPLQHTHFTIIDVQRITD